MPVNPQLLVNLLGSFIGDQAPVRNPNFVGFDENGQPIGNQLPYSTPSWGTKFFHPDVASQEGSLNNAGYDAFRQNLMKNVIAGHNMQVIAPYEGEDPYSVARESPIAAGILASPTAEGMNTAAQASSQINTGLPAVAANEITNRVSMRNRLIGDQEAFERGQYQTGANQFTRDLTPNAMSLLDIEHNAHLGANAANAQVAEGMANESKANLPRQQTLYRGTLGNELWNAANPPTGQSPFVRNTATGLPKRDTSFVNSIEAMNAKLRASEGGIPLGNGNTIVSPGSKGLVGSAIQAVKDAVAPVKQNKTWIHPVTDDDVELANNIKTSVDARKLTLKGAQDSAIGLDALITKDREAIEALTQQAKQGLPEVRRGVLTAVQQDALDKSTKNYVERIKHHQEMLDFIKSHFNLQ